MSNITKSNCINMSRLFQEQGYLVFNNAFSARELDELKNCIQQFIAEFDFSRLPAVFTTGDNDRGRDNYFFDSARKVSCFLEEEAVDRNGELKVPANQAVNKVGHALHDHLPVFAAFCRHERIREALLTAGLDEAHLWQTMYIFKQPRIGGEVRWHQDASYLLTKPASVVGLWLALEDATQSNGCLWMSPGAHRGPLREQFSVDWKQGAGTLETLDSTPWPDHDQAVALEVPAGSMVMFHDHMPHYSSPNRSDQSRQAFTMHFAPSTAKWHPDNWLQRGSLPPFVV